MSDGEDKRTGFGGLTLGYLAMLPLLLAYEAAVAAAGPDGPRNTAELLVTRPLAWLGDAQGAVRLVLILLIAVYAFARLRRGPVRIGASLLRVCGEGVAAGLLLGPLLVLACAALDVTAAELHLPTGLSADPPDLARAARLAGAGAWEEGLFRVGVYSAAFLLAVRTADFLGLAESPARWAGDAAGLAVSALAFAALHLAAFTRVVGVGGEPYDPAVFLWRLLAGLALGVLFRWRGPGVAAWAHALFNLALALGSGPGLFR
ncbi:MAG: CPBP family glutamic-type intramembrane protease [Planctomycetota bacterium]|nr:CPBP family glutamic-type intramembrane protease [Planctomycetota bacterium]